MPFRSPPATPLFTFLLLSITTIASSPSFFVSIISTLPIIDDEIDTNAGTFIHLPSSPPLSSLGSTLHDSVLSSLANILDTFPALPLTSPPSLIKHGFGYDYTILKLVEKEDGTKYSGVFPTFPIPGFPPSASARKLVGRGFTLVVNRLHRRSGKVNEVARMLSLAYNQNFSVTANLYLTPPNSAGFEAHYDYMDVVVFHLSPAPKMWTVYNEPAQLYPLKSTKSPPLPSHLSSTPSTNVTLNQGDVLYIPAGFVHSASSTTSDLGDSVHITFGLELDEMEDRLRGMMEGDDGCIDAIMKDEERGSNLRKPRFKATFQDYKDAIEVVSRECQDILKGFQDEPTWSRKMAEMDERRLKGRVETLESWRGECDVRVGLQEEVKKEL
mmetsp:Transcript_13213/g.26962  ORF Transcript_13213/g.26962 Transcript_13213/m.26962 type:complete len:384 (+) Transcript_13213:49-1200(+)